MFHAPLPFRGSWYQLFRDHIEPNLPAVADVVNFHDWLLAYCQEPAAVFPVRAVRGAQRRRVYSTNDGSVIAPCDNSPAWVVHALLVQQRISSYGDFKAMMASMPAHMFDVAPLGIKTANSYGWYMAHIYPAKNRDIQFHLWPRLEVKRRCLLTLHPCNIFPVPGVRNRQHGEDPRVIAFMADQYAIRYGSTWTEFINEVQAAPLQATADFGSTLVQIIGPSTQQASSSGAAIKCSPQRTRLSADRPAVTSYRAARLTFKRDVIEPLAPNEQFEVVTPFGVYRFTKCEFHSEFSNIFRSASYREHGSYNGKTLHLKARAFRISD